MQATAAQLGIHRRTVALWARHLREQGIGCVWDIAAGRGRNPDYDTDRVAQLVAATLQTKPAGKTLHMILDNYSTHGRASVRHGLEASALRAALHPDPFELAQSRRTLVGRT